MLKNVFFKSLVELQKRDFPENFRRHRTIFIPQNIIKVEDKILLHTIAYEYASSGRAIRKVTGNGWIYNKYQPKPSYWDNLVGWEITDAPVLYLNNYLRYTCAGPDGIYSYDYETSAKEKSIKEEIDALKFNLDPEENVIYEKFLTDGPYLFSTMKNYKI